MDCKHTNVVCINPYDTIRKYRCEFCNEVMMCACDEEFARAYLSHQINFTKDLVTNNRVPVTLGFIPKICNTCRGLPEENHPKASMPGMTSKIHRYYWREIYQIAVQKFSSWSTVNGYNDWLTALVTNEKQFKLFTKEAVAEIKKLHQESPKYIYDDISDNDVCEKYNIQIVNYSPEYFPNEDGRTRVNYKGNSLGVEDYVLAKHKEIGFDGTKCESSPFHVIFGSLMYPILNDSDDPLMQVMETGDRFDFDAGLKPRQLRFWWPRDFGDKGYYLRRKKEIKAHIRELPQDIEGLIWLFDYQLEHSKSIRQYLWAYKEHHIEIARKVLGVLPPNVVTSIMMYLIQNYWKRYVGWPDLLMYNDDEYFFVEVKSSKDSLSGDQKNWIEGNYGILKQPFKLAKLHKQSKK